MPIRVRCSRAILKKKNGVWMVLKWIEHGTGVPCCPNEKCCDNEITHDYTSFALIRFRNSYAVTIAVPHIMVLNVLGTTPLISADGPPSLMSS